MKIIHMDSFREKELVISEKINLKEEKKKKNRELMR